MSPPNGFRDLKERARLLRRTLTPAEARLWSYLQRRQLGGRKFRRQYRIGPYILDFYCPSERIAVELDGAAHDSEQAQYRDAARTAFLARSGVKVIRFENRDVFENGDGVLLAISKMLKRT